MAAAPWTGPHARASHHLKLRPGMFARVQVQLGVREKAVWIPEAAIVPRGQDITVYRVVAGPFATRTDAAAAAGRMAERLGSTPVVVVR